MSLFGKLDAANIPSNPYHIDKGTYSAEVITAKYQENRDGVRQLYIQYEITDTDSEFVGSKPAKTYTLVSDDMTAEALELLPNDEKKKIRLSMSALKKDLCGNETNTSQKGLGVALEDLNEPDWDPAVLVGTKVVINIGNNGNYVNIRWVNLDED